MAGRPLQQVGYNYFIPEAVATATFTVHTNVGLGIISPILAGRAESTTSPVLHSKSHDWDSSPNYADQTPELESSTLK